MAQTAAYQYLLNGCELVKPNKGHGEQSSCFPVLKGQIAQGRVGLGRDASDENVLVTSIEEN
jgi:hypothetical protein